MSNCAPLQMIRADISVRDFQRWMGSRRLQDADHAMHCLLTECFGELAPKPFRALLPPRRLQRNAVRLWNCGSRCAAGRRQHICLPPAIPNYSRQQPGQQADAVGLDGRQTARF